MKTEGKLFPEVGMGSRKEKRVHLCQIKESNEKQDNERQRAPVQLCKGKMRDDTDKSKY